MLLLCRFRYNVGDVMDPVFWATVCKTVCPMLLDHCLSVCPVCDVGVLWPYGWMDQDHLLGPDHTELDGDPNFRPMSVVDERQDGSRCHLVGK